MPTRVRPAELGASDARRLVASIGADVREARLIAGVSQAVVARAAGVSPSTLSRIERGVTRDLRLAPVCRAARALGLAPSFRLFPVGLPVRDAAQLALLQRLEAVLGPPLHLRREVPMPIQGDPRAWDAVIE